MLPENYPAPELTGITDWLNSEPLTLAQLRGNVVLVDFWTYSCINCIRTQEYLNAWYDAYHDDGFEIIGVHAPEFAFEKLPENVRNAIAEAKIKYPVALDNDFATWQAYSNRYWPAKYLIDRDGNIRYVHFGEGDYDETENAIRALLGESGPAAEQPSDPMRHTPGQSPETYLGTERASGFRGSPGLQAGETSYQPDTNIGLNEWTLAGTWQVDDEAITAQADDAQLSYRFTGQGMFLVLDGPPGSSVQVTLEGAGDPGGADAESGTVSIDSARLYHLVQLPQATDGTTVTLQFSKGVSAHAFTFG
ncbi:MAG: hypothetical protein CSA64_05255 [Arachnia propionica]|nr:MAG: hypothetical protein CSA64_05255 [Arachnia propionica]